MSADAMDLWFKSKRKATIAGESLWPVAHPLLPDTPIAIKRGQGENYLLEASDNDRRILKKFNEGRALDRSYLEKVSVLLPSDPAFLSGKERRVLTPGDLQQTNGSYHQKDLAAWLDGTLLMTQVSGFDWATIADELREGRLQLTRSQRVSLCRDLARITGLLERACISHRDYSSSNVFIKKDECRVALIDYESTYHPSLVMPHATTCGTSGYTAHHTWWGSGLDPKRTWCQRADRYALCILVVEFLILDKGAPLTAEGGMFDQDELRARTGHKLNHFKKMLAAQYPEPALLFDRVLNSRSFEDCPSPEEWTRACDKIAAPSSPAPQPPDSQFRLRDFLAKIWGSKRAAAPLWPAPRLAELPDEPLQILRPRIPVVTLPEDPWRA